jgi:hypothetical protein
MAICSGSTIPYFRHHDTLRQKLLDEMFSKLSMSSNTEYIGKGTETTKGPRPLVQCRFRPVPLCASMSVAVAASRAVQLQTWYRKLTPHPSYYSLLLPLYVLHRPLSTQE